MLSLNHMQNSPGRGEATIFSFIPPSTCVKERLKSFLAEVVLFYPIWQKNSSKLLLISRSHQRSHVKQHLTHQLRGWFAMISSFHECFGACIINFLLSLSLSHVSYTIHSIRHTVWFRLTSLFCHICTCTHNLSRSITKYKNILIRSEL